MSIVGSLGHGVTVSGAGRGRLEDCEISDARGSALYTSEGGSPELVRVTVTTSGEIGVLVGPSGGGTLQDCRITASGQHGVAVADGELRINDLHDRVERRRRRAGR
jgi:hypothetical protein